MNIHSETPGIYGDIRFNRDFHTLWQFEWLIRTNLITYDDETILMVAKICDEDHHLRAEISI